LPDQRARVPRRVRQNRRVPRFLSFSLLRAGLLALCALPALAGCGTVGYYAQAVRGHLALLSAARPVDELLADPATGQRLRTQLEKARAMRTFAARELALPDNRSYTAYADLKRPAVVWNVFAVPELSLRLKNWCYPLFGCAGYRGYFAQADAEATAAQLRGEGYDVSVGAVPAYSTLGWMEWAGGDPLLNTFIYWSDGELARLIFHELAHQVLYVNDDTVFNESFATAVERAGVRRWLAAHGDAAARDAYTRYEERRADFLALLLEHKAQLAAAYADATTDDDKRARKRAVLDGLQRGYRGLRDGKWGGFAGYDRYFSQSLNGAHLAAVGAYNELVPAFEALLAAQGGDLPRFYAEVKKLAELPKAERSARLKALAG
jgi:predicted aminopeptidase